MLAMTLTDAGDALRLRREEAEAKAAAEAEVARRRAKNEAEEARKRAQKARGQSQIPLSQALSALRALAARHFGDASRM